MDQLSPEYGGTGRRREDLPSLADALFAAGSRAGAGEDGGVVGGSEGDLGDGVRPRGQLSQGPPRVAPTPKRGLEEDKEEEQQQLDEEEDQISSKGNGRTGWFSAGAGASSWGPLGWVWSSWGGSGGAADGGGVVRGDAEESIVTADEEVKLSFFVCLPCRIFCFLFFLFCSFLFLKVVERCRRRNNVQGALIPQFNMFFWRWHVSTVRRCPGSRASRFRSLSCCFPAILRVSRA